MAPKRQKKATAAQRVRHLLALDAARVMARLEKRQGEVVTLFSRLRDREPLLAMVHSWFGTATFAELATLEPFEQAAAHAFHDLLDELRWYLTYTEDMPLTVQSTLDQLVRRLEEAHRVLVTHIGPPSGRGAPVVDAEVVARAVKREPVGADAPGLARRREKAR